MVTREDFFRLIPAPKTEEVEVKGVGTFRVRMLSAGERDAFEAEAIKASVPNGRARLLAATVVDSDDKPLFRVEDVPSIAGKSAKHLEPLVNAAMRLNAITDRDFEELEKN